MMDLSPWRRYIEDALATGWQGHTYEDVCRGVEDEMMQIWTRPDAAIVTQVIQYPQFMQLYVFLAGGNLATLEQMAPEIEEWGRVEHGCTRAVFIGRPGWQRTFLNRTGWRVEPVVYMEKEL
jgi:hypothetical protein